MIRQVPHDIDYKTVNKVSSVSKALLYSTATIYIFLLSIEFLEIFSNPNKEYLIWLFNNLISLLSVTYFFLDIVLNYLFQKAEENRRNDFIDNSLGTVIAPINSVGYFSNDSLGKGVYKMGVNCFENSFFSKEVSNKMKIREIVKAATIIILFIGIALFTSPKLLNALLQLALPFTILQNTIRLILFNMRMKQIFENFSTVFAVANTSQRDYLLIYFVLKYETTLAWGGISLDSKIFHKLNSQLSIQWDNLKARYNII